METAFVRDVDRLPDEPVPLRTDPDPRPILGSWKNTNRSTWGIARAVVTHHDGQVRIHLWGTDPRSGTRYDWGEVPVGHLYTDGPLSDQVCAYTATVDLGHARAEIQVNMAYGLTVLAAFTTFTDGSGRLDYFSREFFDRLD